MNYYFHESMVAKMVSSNEYQEGYSVGFASGYNQGKADGIEKCIEEIIPTLCEFDVEQEVIDYVQKWLENLKEQVEMKCFNKEDCMECEHKIRADERTKVFDEIKKFINTPNRGNCDYFIIDQIENYINSYK